MIAAIEVGDRQAEELRLAMLSVFLAATGRDRADCAATIDAAAARAVTASRRLVASVGAPEPVQARFGAARLINTLCGACGQCPRGRAEDTPVMTPPPPSGTRPPSRRR